MLLVFDAGNSEITVGLYNNDSWKYIWRIPSVPYRPELFYGIKLREFFFECSIPVYDVKKIVVSSVVPELTDKIINVAITLFGQNPLVLGTELYKKLPIKVLNPYEIGADLVANAMAGYKLFNGQCIIVDFGTALTFTTVSSSGEILGVSIAPGLKTAIKSLSQNTAKLFDVPLEMPSTALGKNTVQAIQSGVLISYEGAVSNMLKRIKIELQGNVSTVATGGLSSVIPSLPSMVDKMEPNLTLDGLRLISEVK
jgi:type III pantothenate kinase